MTKPRTAKRSKKRPPDAARAPVRRPMPGARQVAEADLPTRWGRFRIFGFELDGDGSEPAEKKAASNRPATLSRAARAKPNAGPESAVALVMGDIRSAPPLVRVHSQCLTGDVFGSLRCDCREQLEIALGAIASAGSGILIYEQQEGRGIGLMPKLQAYQLQDEGLDTVEANERLGFAADLRSYALPGAILRALGVNAVRLLSNNPAKVAALEASGVRVVERVPCEAAASAAIAPYLETKRRKMGHILSRRRAIP